MFRFTTPVGWTAVAVMLASHAVTASATALDPETPRRIVRFADLDIEHAAGAASLYARITNAAREVCEPRFTWQVSFNLEAIRCRQKSVERAVQDVNSSELTSYHQMKTRSLGDRR
jgi:UrcA family protein